MFLVLGAWPVFGFFGLDVLLIYWAFRANFRAARAYEVVTVTASELTVRQVSHRGRVREWTLNPLWVRLDRIVHEEFGIERLFLVSHGRRLPIAAFLGPHEKASFARALSNALGEAKRGPTRTVVEQTDDSPSQSALLADLHQGVIAENRVVWRPGPRSGAIWRHPCCRPIAFPT